MSCHQPHHTPPQKMPSPLKKPSSFPKHSKPLVPRSAFGRSRQKYWSSIFPAGTHPGKLQEMQAERKASRRGGQSLRIPIKLNTTLTAYTQIQRVWRILKLLLVLGASKHHQDIAQQCSSMLQEERKCMQLPGPPGP